jgi:ADP-heptose:LPS heptosyltransferase
VLFTTALIRAIKESYADSFIGYWCNQRVCDILKNNPRIDIIFALSRGDLKKIYRQSKFAGIREFFSLLCGIKRQRFDILLDFSLDHRYSLIAKIIGIKERVGFNYKNRGRFLTDKINIEGYNGKHVVEYYLELLDLIGVRAKAANLELSILQDCRIKGKGILAEYGAGEKDLIIGIAPGAGASWGLDARLKHWSAKSFGQLADRIIDDFRAKIVILGDESEKPLADTIINNMHNKPINLAGKTTLEELCGIIDNLQVLVANDGGPLHIAVALARRTVSFFGPVDPKVYGPYPPDEKRHIVLRKVLDCSPCYSKFHLSPCPKDKECLNIINVEEAKGAVGRLLK